MRRLRRWLQLFTATFQAAWKHDVLGQAKGAAFSTILFFFPLLLFVVTVLVLTGSLTLVVMPVVDFVPALLPPETRALVMDYIDKTAALDPTKAILLSFVAMLWTGWGLMSSFIEGVNRAYGLHEDRALLRNQWAAIKLLVSVSIPVIALVATAILAARLEHSLAGHGRVLAPSVWKVVKWGAIVAAMIAANAIIYRVGVHRKQRWREVIPGALLATLIWLASTEAFRAYAARFGRYNLIYGSLGAAIILFVWMYFTSFAVILGGEFNAVLAHRRTTGRPG